MCEAAAKVFLLNSSVTSFLTKPCYWTKQVIFVFLAGKAMFHVT